MLSRSEIIRALQFSHFFNSNPLNQTSSPRYEITYQYAGTSQPGDLPTNTSYSGWRDFRAAEKANFEAALTHIESFLNVDFVEVTHQSDPDLNVGAVSLTGGFTGYGGYNVFYSGPRITEWDSFVVFSASLDLSSPQTMHLLLHELGHALGLRHTFDDDGDLPVEYDSNLYSVMSYTANPVNGQDSDAMMLFDVLALQDIWGQAGYNSGDTTYNAVRSTTVDAIWDSGGRDTLDASTRQNDVKLDLRQGAFSSLASDSDIVITFGTQIENAIGGRGQDSIAGNGQSNQLNGGRGNDTLQGLQGNDSLFGSEGRDRLIGNKGQDQLRGGLGADRLFGSEGADQLHGGGARDRLFGGAGKDTLFGGAGNDRLDGQVGNDRLIGGSGADRFVFKASGGQDTITDFQDDIDTLEIIGHGNSSSLLAAASDTNQGVVFDFGTDTLLVRGISLAELTDDLLI